MLKFGLFATATLVLAMPVQAQNAVAVDAREKAPEPKTGYLKLGTNRSPDGTVLGINSQYLTLNGKPWLPMMGEMHFVRIPANEWDSSLAKIKASGIDIVATYLFWNYHEETPGAFNWSGQHDVRRFVQIAAKHGLKVIVRLGPWAHGEVRYGGIPDWVVRSVPLRGSDPVYMRYVDRYWAQIGRQLQGLFWKDGGHPSPRRCTAICTAIRTGRSTGHPTIPSKPKARSIHARRSWITLFGFWQRVWLRKERGQVPLGSEKAMADKKVAGQRS